LIRGSAFLLNGKQMLETKNKPNRAGKTQVTVIGLTPKYEISVNLRLPMVDQMKQRALFFFTKHGGETLQFYERDDNIIDVEFVNSADEQIASHHAQFHPSEEVPVVVVHTRVDSKEIALLRESGKPHGTIFECAPAVLIRDSPASFLNCISECCCPKGTSVQRICSSISKYMFCDIHIS